MPQVRATYLAKSSILVLPVRYIFLLSCPFQIQVDFEEQL